jgi:hypothetical protein
MNEPSHSRLERYFDGELAEPERIRIENEIADDPEAARHLSALAAIRDLARRHDPAADVPRRPGLDAMPRQRDRPASRPPRRAPRLAVGLAASLALALVGWSLMGRPAWRADAEPGRPTQEKPVLLGRSRPTSRAAGLHPPGRDRVGLVRELALLDGGDSAAFRESLLSLPATARAASSAPRYEMLAIELANHDDDDGREAARRLLAARPASRRPPSHPRRFVETGEAPAAKRGA